MGNHSVGKAVGRMADEALRGRRDGESAIEILDRICTPYRNSDAEWDAADPADPTKTHPEFVAYTDPHARAALGMLMLEAFAPNGVADRERYAPMLDSDDPDEEVACEAWWAEVYEPFKQRYGFS